VSSEFRALRIVELEAAPPPVYRPAMDILPLINVAVLYRTCLTGSVTFLDSQGQPLLLPDGVANYDVVREYSDDYAQSTPVAVALYDQAGRVAFLRLDGTMATEFVYLPFGAGDSAEFPSKGGYAQVMRDVSGYEGYGLYGLLDLRTGREVLDCVYDNMRLFDDCLWAAKDGESWFLDYTGRELFACGATEVDFYWSDDGLIFWGDKFLYEGSTGRLYATDYGADTLVCLYGDMVVLTSDWTDRLQTGDWADYSRTVRAFDLTGHLLCEDEVSYNYYAGGAYLSVLLNGQVKVLSLDGTLTLPLPERLKPTDVVGALFEDGLLCLTYQDENFDRHELVIDEEGAEVSDQLVAEESYEWMDGPVRHTEEGCELLDGQGGVLIPMGLYDNMEVWGSFVLCMETQELTGQELTAIAGPGGQILLDAPYGAIYELPRADAMVAYKDENTCGLLYTDGRFDPIPDAPPVAKEYFGG
jgi:hypothetical protein